MPLFAVICRDKPDHLQTRMETRERHLAYLAERPVVQFAGPFIEGGSPIGSLLVVEAESIAAAQDWAANDPYAQAGLFASVEVIEWRKVIG
ncbi:YciI family protein [Paracoccus aestuariivivens]|uniref:YciI family protein n=2 Tax=Paracoccus aestuariivivens TaxID=1820333 RepID=A0A6L6JEG5_9RHOB|nr:YciI family protein [Paracoccus aestuariivivens]